MRPAPIRPVRTVLLLVILAATLACPVATRADSFVDQANLAAFPGPGTKSVEEALFPALAKLEKRPRQPAWYFLVTWDDGWDDLAEWAAAAPQQAVLEAVATLADPDDKYLIGIPYTNDNTPQEWLDAGLYAQVGPQDLLAHTRFPYLDRMNEIGALACIEALRLADDGQGQEALDTLMHMGWLGRILVERPSTPEKLTGIYLMRLATNRLLDVLYLHPEAFDATMVSKTAERFDPRELDLWKFPFPVFEKIAAEQILDRAFELKGDVRASELAKIFAAQSITGERPLLAFRDAALYVDSANNHAGWWDTRDAIDNVIGDWEMRWKFPNRNDPVLRHPTDFSKLPKSEYTLIDQVLGPSEELLPLRRDLYVFLSGAYNAMGVVAFKLREDRWPPSLPAVEPEYVAELIDDLWNPDKRFRQRTAVPVLDGYQYFVPIRDQTFGRREEPHPHAITVRFSVARGFGGDMGGGFGGGLGAMPFDLGPMGGGLGDAGAAQIMGLLSGADSIDYDAVRESLLEELRNAEMTDDDLREMERGVREMLDDGVTEAPFRDVIDAAIAEEDPDGQGLAMLEAMGVDVDELLDLVSDVADQVLRDPAVRRVFQAVKDGDDLTESMAREAAEKAVTIAVQPEFVDPLIEIGAQVLQSMGPMLTAGVGSDVSEFEAEVDESQFVLYSLGEDGEDGEARFVGDLGSDILIWPPPLTLAREYVTDHERLARAVFPN